MPERPRGAEEEKDEEEIAADAGEPEQEIVEEEILVEVQKKVIETEEIADEVARVAVEVPATSDEMEEPEGETEEKQTEGEDTESTDNPEELVVPREEVIAKAEEAASEPVKDAVAATAEPKAEGRPHVPVAPNRNFESKTQIPISPFNSISGTHGAPAFGRIPPAPLPPVELRNSL
jgi:hypothetical protein